ADASPRRGGCSSPALSSISSVKACPSLHGRSAQWCQGTNGPPTADAHKVGKLIGAAKLAAGGSREIVEKIGARVIPVGFALRHVPSELARDECSQLRLRVE